MREILAELGGIRVQNRGRPPHRLRQAAHHGIHQTRLGRAGQRLGLLDRMMDDARYSAALVVGRGFDQLETRDEENRARREARWMRHQPAQRGVDPAEVSHHADHQMLAAGAVGAGEDRRQFIQQNVQSLPAFQPAGHEARGNDPRRGGG